eukprot:jgi/Picsp_1/2336/NSC_05799-R1_sucrose phosphatase
MLRASMQAQPIMGPKLPKKKKLVLVSDLDWTMVNHKDVNHRDLLRFNKVWTKHFAEESVLIYSSGRSPTLYKELALEAPLLAPDILVCSVGTEILVHGVPDAEWERYLDEGWDREQVVTIVNRFPELVMQQASEQRPHKVSYKLYAADANQAQGVVSNLRAHLTGAGIQANVIFSGGQDLDVLPSRASKGKALSFLLQQLEEANGCAPEHGVIVCGDSGNDVELFQVPGVHGCVVANAHDELREWYEENKGNKKIFLASLDGPAGIRESLMHFGFVDLCTAHDKMVRRSCVVDLHSWFERYFADEQPDEGYDDIAHDDVEGIGFVARQIDGSFELIAPSGSISSKTSLLGWLQSCGRGSQAHSVAQSDGSPPAVFRIWIDQYSERELVPGSDIWLVQYYECQQKFPCSSTEQRRGRTVRVASAILKKQQGHLPYSWYHVHETWVERFPSIEGVAGQ